MWDNNICITVINPDCILLTFAAFAYYATLCGQEYRPLSRATNHRILLVLCIRSASNVFRIVGKYPSSAFMSRAAREMNYKQVSSLSFLPILLLLYPAINTEYRKMVTWGVPTRQFEMHPKFNTKVILDLNLFSASLRIKITCRTLIWGSVGKNEIYKYPHSDTTHYLYNIYTFV